MKSTHAGFYPVLFLLISIDSLSTPHVETASYQSSNQSLDRRIILSEYPDVIQSSRKVRSRLFSQISKCQGVMKEPSDFTPSVKHHFVSTSFLLFCPIHLLLPFFLGQRDSAEVGRGRQYNGRSSVGRVFLQF